MNKRATVTASCGNVFEDLGLPEADRLLREAEARLERAELTAVATKAFGRITARWHLSTAEAAALLDAPATAWETATGAGEPFDLTGDQLLRVSAVIGIYKALETYFDEPLAGAWISRKNSGPLFDGRRPIEVMAHGGLPTILAVREYLDDLLGG